MRDGYHTRAWPEQLLEILQIDGAIWREVDQADTRASLQRDALPGHEIGVMLQGGGQDLVARLQVRAAPTRRDQVQAFGGVAHEDELVRVIGTNEASDTFTRRFVQIGRFNAEGVHAAVHVGVRIRIEVDQRINDLTRLLRGRRIIEVNQRSTVDLALEDRKVRTDPLDVQRVGLRSF